MRQVFHYEREPMIANYHTHTWRCLHAEGTEREYVEAAIAGGLKILGFSDHTPMPYDNGHVNHFKMTFDQVEDYVTTVLDLKREYKQDIDIHLGLEVEYYPRYFETMTRMLEDYPIEYFLLGQHFLGNEIDDVFSNAPTDSEETLRRYCEQVKEALSTGSFTYLAHPDLVQYTGPDAIYQTYMRDLCRFAKAHQIPLEINFLGISDHRNYPDQRFWKLAGEVGNDVVFGSDAHVSDMVWNPSALKTAEEMVSTYHLHLLETVPFRSPF